jgi:hypothetical protein
MYRVVRGDEKLALARVLRRAIEDDPYPLSPRLLILQAIRAKIEPQPTVVAKPCPAPWPGDRPRVALAAMKPRRNR